MGNQIIITAVVKAFSKEYMQLFREGWYSRYVLPSDGGVICVMHAKEDEYQKFYKEMNS